MKPIGRQQAKRKRKIQRYLKRGIKVKSKYA